MKLDTVVLYASARRERAGIRVAKFIGKQAADRDHAVRLIDCANCGLPMLDLMYKEYAPGEAPRAMRQIGEGLAAADGFIVVAAEYNHSIPAALKNLLDHYQSEYHYKPSGIVTYSAGPFGGVRGLVNLRAILAELGTPSIPTSLPVSRVSAAFDDDGAATETAYIDRARRFFDEYEWYARALKRARESDAP